MKATDRTSGRPRDWDAADHAAIHRRVQRYARKRGWADERLRLEDCTGLGDGGSLWWFLPAAVFAPFAFVTKLREAFRVFLFGGRWLFGTLEPADHALREEQWFAESVVYVIFFGLVFVGTCGYFGLGSTLHTLLSQIPGLRSLRGESVLVRSKRATDDRRTKRYITLEREGRAPREYRASDEAYSDARPGHAGFAFLGLNRVWEFRHYRTR